MKKIFKISTIALLLVSVWACENDDQAIIVGKGGPELITPTSGTAYVLSPENATSEATTLVWNHADYNQQTAANYEVEVALAGTNFQTIISGGTTVNSARFLVWTVGQLNTLALSAGIEPFVEGSLDVRVKSSLGNNSDIIQYSNNITIKVTPYTTESPKLWVPGGYQQDSGYGNNFSHATAPLLSAKGYGETEFEGYVYIANDITSTDNGFKFSTQENWDGTNYGAGATPTTVSPTGANITATAGYYRVKVDTNPEALSLNMTQTTWGIIGNSTPGGWENSTPMTYDPATKKWWIVVALTAQSAPDNGWKFRANNSWDINLGDAVLNATDGILSEGGSNIGIATAGTYRIELDLSNPRDYKYTIVRQ